MEPIKITRNIGGQDVEIVLTWDEMWQAREVAELLGCMEDIQDMLEQDVPEEELADCAEKMRNYMIYNNMGYSEARDAVCDENELWEKYGEN